MMKVEERWLRLRLRQWLAICATAGVIACGGGSGDDDDDSTGVPDPYTPPAEGAPACELSADCPAGTYCDLGQCYQVCNTEVSCAETSEACSNRGRCQAGDPGGNDIEPPLDSTNRAEVALEGQPELSLGETDSTATIELTASPTDVDIRYRIEPKVPWLRVGDPRGSFRGALFETLTVDRAGLEPGQHSGVVVVHTTEGNRTLAVHLTQGLGASYHGAMTYEAPFSIGSAPLEIEVLENAGVVTLRVDASESPLFMHGSPQGLSTAGAYSDGTVTATLHQRIEATDLSSERFWAGALGRELEVVLSPTSEGGLQGTFTESWHGLLADPIVVSGSMSLARSGTATPGFGPDAAPAMPEPPDTSAPELTTDCSEAAAAAAGLPLGNCVSTSSDIQQFSCGNAIRAVGARLEDPDSGLLVSSEGRGYAKFSTECKFNLVDAGLELVSNAPPACVRPGNFRCARSLFALTTLSEGYRGVGDVAANYAAVGALLLNDAIVEAFRQPYDSAVDDTAVEQAMLDALDDGRTQARLVLRRIFEPHILASLLDTPVFIAQQEGYKPLRRIAHLLGRYRLASDERARIQIRAVGLNDSGLATIRARTAEEMTSLLVGLLALSVIADTQEAPPSAELGLFAEALTGLGSLFNQLRANQDPLGLPSGFVEFIYDPAEVGDGSTNYAQSLTRHKIELDAALVEEAAAEAANREFDTNVALIEAELEELQNQSNARLISLCGADPLDASAPELDACGSTTGDIAQVRAEIDVELQNVSTATTRIESHQARIRVQIERISAIESIRGQTVEFVEETGARLDANAYADASYARMQDIISAGTGFFSQLAQGNFAGAVIGAMGSYGNALYSDLRRQLAIEREQLLRAQQLQIMEADYAVESITMMANLKELFILGSELYAELALAKLRLVAATLRLQTLFEQVRVTQAEHELRASQVTASFANDPMFRLLRDRATARAVAARERALLGIYKAARAFEFEINTPFDAIYSHLVPAHRAGQIQDFVTCMESRFTDFRGVYGVPTQFQDEISLREDVLGIHAPIVDDVTGAVVSEAEQFRRLLLQPSNRSRFGGVGVSFATSLSPGNGVFSTGVCNDQLETLRVKLVGDGLGDDQARVRIEQAGTSLVRSCEAFRGGGDDLLNGYDLPPRSVEVQAGINAYPDAWADAQFFGRSVAASDWLITIPPGAEAPPNADVDLTRIDDIVIEISHRATSLSDGPLTFDPSCN